MNKKFLFLAILMLLSICPINTANAIEALNYNRKISTSLKHQINLFLGNLYNNDISEYEISGIDLNGDGIDEHVLKSKKCDADNNQCNYLIIAEKRDEIILLSEIKAGNIIIGGTSSYGIKDILVFKNNINDYNFDIYIWSPEQKMYIMKITDLKNQG